jgi:hypothetical protein
MLMTISPETPSESKATPQTRQATAKSLADTDILPAVEPPEAITLERLTFHEHLNGMVALRRHWDRVMKWF